ncbi:hypothetical protein J3458_007257 [Metarhizium acridum]|uniref:uncharacterized protein n=1 Tax=Metarhizium acridum TaxID=92637 RepID=UPI001C6B1798|nr:hypothetical protein J3458_007257 [Metarhizium acridum]
MQTPFAKSHDDLLQTPSSINHRRRLVPFCLGPCLPHTHSIRMQLHGFAPPFDYDAPSHPAITYPAVGRTTRAELLLPPPQQPACCSTNPMQKVPQPANL